jgi:hypothetical protein
MNLMLPDKFLKNNCIKNPADINRVLHFSIKVPRAEKPTTIFRKLMEFYKCCYLLQYAPYTFPLLKWTIQ